MKALFYLHSVRDGRPETHARRASRNLAAVPPLTLQNPNDRRYCVPVPRRRRRTEEFVDLAKIADRFHVTAIHSEHELVFRPDDSHQPLSIRRKCDWKGSPDASGLRQDADESNNVRA